MRFLKMDFEADFEDRVSHSYKYFMSAGGGEWQRLSKCINNIIWRMTLMECHKSIYDSNFD